MKNIFKTILGGVDKGVEVAAALHLPVFAQVDAVKDAVNAAVENKSISMESAAEIVGGIEATRTEALAAIETAKALPVGQKGLLESKRFLAAVAALVGVVAIYLGVPAEHADKLAMIVSGIVGAYMVGETVRPSMK